MKVMALNVGPKPTKKLDIAKWECYDLRWMSGHRKLGKLPL